VPYGLLLPLGSVVNWALGRWCLHWQGRRWFPVGEAALARAHDRFARWGAWSLLFAWLPVVGDPLTFAWDLDGDGQYNDSEATAPQFTFATAGKHSVRVRVTDSRGASATTGNRDSQ